MTDIIVLSDTHIGLSVALCPPSIDLDDGGTYHSSREQRWLWDNWLQFLDRVDKLAQPILVLNGDIIEQDVKRRSYQVVTRNPATIQRVAANVLDPLVKMCSKTYYLRGTPAHSGKSGNYEEMLAEDIGAVQSPTTKAYSRYHLPIMIDGVRLDIAHHGQMGSAVNSRPLAVLRLAWQTMLAYQIDGSPIPDLVIRGHQHRWADSYDAYPTRGLYTPGWCLATEFIESKSPGGLADIGATILHINGGKYEIEKAQFKAKRRWERL